MHQCLSCTYTYVSPPILLEAVAHWTDLGNEYTKSHIVTGPESILFSLNSDSSTSNSLLTWA